MPYSRISELPPQTDGLPKHAKEIFMAAFNSSADSGDAESKSFAIAWAAVKQSYEQDADGEWHRKEKRGIVVDIRDLFEQVAKAFAPFLKEKPRAVESGNLVCQLYDLVDKMNESAMIPRPSTGMPGEEEYWDIDDSKWISVIDLFYNTDGSMYLLVNQGGALYKLDVTLNDDETVSLSDAVRVTQEHPPLPTARSKFSIERQADGKVRWFSVSCTAALNRDLEIDSRKLFDSFVKRLDEGAKFPYRTFFHQGEAFKTGMTDFVARDENVLLTSGLYDDSELAQMEIAAREKDPGYWGESIGYRPESDPELLTLNPDLTIPVYTDGTLLEISTLPKTRASAPFTRTTQEVTRMMDKAKFAAFVKLCGGDEAKARKWLEDNADETNRAIETSAAVTRETEPKPEGAPAPTTVPEPTPPTPVPAVTATPAPEVARENNEIVLDDEAMSAIAKRALQDDEIKKVLDSITTLQATLTTLNESVAALEKTQAAMKDEAQARMAKLEMTEEEKRRDWIADLPQRQTVVTVRPREVRVPVNGNSVSKKEIAEQTLAMLEKKAIA